MKHVTNGAIAGTGIAATAVGTMALLKNNYWAAVDEKMLFKVPPNLYLSQVLLVNCKI